MPGNYQIFLQGDPAPAEFYERISQLDIEENADMPGAIKLRLSVTRDQEGDLTVINDVGLQPLHNIAVVAQSDEGRPQCIFDGYVLSHKIHLEPGTAASYLEVYGQDASWLMNLEEKTREWVNQTDCDVADAIFQEYGMSPSPDNTSEESPMHSEDGHTLMQRSTDIQFLRMLARRIGRLCRVSCESTPGERIGIFAKPNMEGDPVLTLRPNHGESANVNALDFEWDVMRPTRVKARQAMFDDSSPEGANGDSDSSGLTDMDERGLVSFTGQPMITMLTAPVDSGGELRQRAHAVLREAGWFARCIGESDLTALGAILRVGQVVRVEAVGSVHSGNFLVWSVNHTLSDQRHSMRFTLVRNAVGPSPGSFGW